MQIRVFLSACAALLMLTAASSSATQATDTLTFETAPEPEHRVLFKLLMAAHGAALDNETYAWQHFYFFQAPPRDSAECAALEQNLSNEIGTRRLVEQARTVFRKELAAAADWPRAARFRLKTRERIGDYQFDKGVFPLRHYQGNFRIAWSEGMTAGGSAHYRGPTPPRPCASVHFAGLKLDSKLFIAPSMTQFALTLQVGGKLRDVPVGRSQAEALLKGRIGGGRMVEMELLVVAEAPEAPPVGSGVTFPARVLAARALNRDTGEVLHTFEPSPLSK